MKCACAEDKTALRSSRGWQSGPHARHRGISLAPPGYGIDFVDQGMSHATAPQPGTGVLQKTPDHAGEHRAESGQHQSHQTGPPGPLKSGIEALSGMSMDGVKVHYHSSRPAQLDALAYTQGDNIYLQSGQERHLPHEAWHVVQQRQGQVKPTSQAKGVAINDDPRLERQADIMGNRAAQAAGPVRQLVSAAPASASLSRGPIQRQVAVAKNRRTNDFVELNSIDYSLKRAGGPVDLFKNSQFGALDKTDSLYIVGHGCPGKSGDIPTTDMVARLTTDPPVGLTDGKGPKEIVLTSCYAGLGKTQADDSDSVVGDLHKALHAKWPDVKFHGARGPSGKADSLGDAFVVVDDSKKVDVPNAGQKKAWVVVQYILMAFWEPAEETASALSSLDSGATIEEQAAAAAAAVETFYQAWANAMREPAASSTLNKLRVGRLTLSSTRLQYLKGKLGASKDIDMSQVSALITAIQKFKTLTLAKPMTEL